jgi:hypothetical protein
VNDHFKLRSKCPSREHKTTQPISHNWRLTHTIWSHKSRNRKEEENYHRNYSRVWSVYLCAILYQAVDWHVLITHIENLKPSMHMLYNRNGATKSNVSWCTSQRRRKWWKCGNDWSLLSPNSVWVEPSKVNLYIQVLIVVLLPNYPPRRRLKVTVRFRSSNASAHGSTNTLIRLRWCLIVWCFGIILWDGLRHSKKAVKLCDYKCSGIIIILALLCYGRKPRVSIDLPSKRYEEVVVVLVLQPCIIRPI